MKRVLVTVLVGCAVVAVGARPASAHVTVTAPGATRGGGDQEITFRVPVEKDVATVGFTVALPTATPIASVDVEPVAGWTHTEKTSKLAAPIKTDDGDITEAVTQIAWTAKAGQGLQPGEFGAFTIIAGQLPDAASLVFGAVQTYRDGSVVRWNETAAPGSTVEPENPAPVLKLSGAPGASASSAPAVTRAVSKTSTTGPTVLAVIALVVAALALGVAVVGNARRRT